MQTFLPFQSFTRSAEVLDRQRLGKQRVECVQILNTLLYRRKAWGIHPAVLMWAGYEQALFQYTLAVTDEWAERGYQNIKVLDSLVSLCKMLQDAPVVLPPWLGKRDFHRSHQSNLLRKNPAHYGQFNWNVPHDLEYVWPVRSKMVSQRFLYAESVKRCRAFLKLNKIALPRFTTYDEVVDEYDIRLTGMIRGGATVGMATGFYTKHPRLGPTVYVNLAKCAVPVLIPGARRWSYPCWKTDRTPMGVVAHEVGHHVGVVVSAKYTGDERAVRRDWWKIAARGKKVTGYEPNFEEAAAETLRLFILNSTLLEAAMPRRYKFMTEVLGLKPSEQRDWREVLGNHPEYVAAGERWITK